MASLQPQLPSASRHHQITQHFGGNSCTSFTENPRAHTLHCKPSPPQLLFDCTLLDGGQTNQEDGHIGRCVSHKAGASDANNRTVNNTELMRVAGFQGVADNAAPAAGPLFDLNKKLVDSSNVGKMSSPLPVEVGGLRETALSMTVAQFPQPQADVLPRPLQIPKRESEHHLPDLPQNRSATPRCRWRIMCNESAQLAQYAGVLVRDALRKPNPPKQRSSVAASRAEALQSGATFTMAPPPAMNNSPWHWHNARSMPTLIGRRGFWGCAGTTSCELDVSSLNDKIIPNSGAA